ncbi:unnamed protein product [Heligmosomoides polygyrus]|uniref:Uncharacterized protein n=1 Tax=Heligmosomoides polygyrus TaxID=6339 RepID=A0A183FQ45_HELPZ|nr:unnamed protein product [Heligmosomoides polygyrus]
MQNHPKPFGSQKSEARYDAKVSSSRPAVLKVPFPVLLGADFRMREPVAPTAGKHTRTGTSADVDRQEAANKYWWRNFREQQQQRRRRRRGDDDWRRPRGTLPDFITGNCWR